MFLKQLFLIVLSINALQYSALILAPHQDMWYIEITLHLIYHSLGGDLSTFSSTSSFSRSNTTFDTGLFMSLFMVLFLPAWSTLPIFNLTLHTNHLSSQYVYITLHICQSFPMVFASCKITISPTIKFFLVFMHFFLS